ncbi:MAG: hypothetical protein ACTHON_18330 [Humibacter sp.]
MTGRQLMAQLRALYREHPELLDLPVHFPDGRGGGEITYAEVETVGEDQYVNLYDKPYDFLEVHDGRRDAQAYVPKR